MLAKYHEFAYGQLDSGLGAAFDKYSETASHWFWNVLSPDVLFYMLEPSVERELDIFKGPCQQKILQVFAYKDGSDRISKPSHDFSHRMKV